MIMVRIVGGLGNQMFQYATARAVAIGRPLPLGKGVRLGVGAHAPHSSIGDHFYLAGGASLFDTSIGKYCSIGDAAMIGLARRPTHGHVSTYPGFFSSSNSSARPGTMPVTLCSMKR
jgi:hypothetical protein